MSELSELFFRRCREHHNIDQHLPLLLKYARQCGHITELGTDVGFSTTAFLVACPSVVHCYDIVKQPFVEELERLSGGSLKFHLEDTLKCGIEETDLLFIDTEHTYNQVRSELNRHGCMARQFIILHDIVSFPCIVPAIEEYFLANPQWKLREWSTIQCGLAVYEKVRNGQKGVGVDTPASRDRPDGLVQSVRQGWKGSPFQ